MKVMIMVVHPGWHFTINSTLFVYPSICCDQEILEEMFWNFPSTEIEMSYLRLEGSELLLLVFSQRDGQVKKL